MKNAAFKPMHSVGIAVHNATDPSKEEWDAFLEMSAALIKGTADNLANFRLFIITDGGGPNAAQRKALLDYVKEARNNDQIKVAVISRSAMARGVVTAFNWIGAPLRSFAPDQVAEAFAFIGASNAEAADICAVVEALCSTVDGAVRSAARIKEHRIKLGA